MKQTLFFLALLLGFSACKTDDVISDPIDQIDPVESVDEVIVYYINDPHGKIHNFAKIKDIVQQDRDAGKQVALVCSGDLFSGDPTVDNYPEKGYPMIDLMNKLDFDVSVIGNHEFDYGQEVLNARMEQSEFEWICANMDTDNAILNDPKEYITLSFGDFDITFLGLVETYGREGYLIPATHPYKVEGIDFYHPADYYSNYSNLQEEEGSDMLIALSHLGYYSSNEFKFRDIDLAEEADFVDMIIGGHSHVYADTVVNNTPIYQAGAYLNTLGKITIQIDSTSALSYDYETVDLNDYQFEDAEIAVAIQAFEQDMDYLNDVIGNSAIYHNKYGAGCLYTEALYEMTEVDFVLQNRGGIRAPIEEGEITIRDLLLIDPFNNNTVKIDLSIAELKTFLEAVGGSFFFHGLRPEIVSGGSFIILDENLNEMDDSEQISMAINDYMVAVFEDILPETQTVLPKTTSEYFIEYISMLNEDINIPFCYNYID